MSVAGRRIILGIVVCLEAGAIVILGVLLGKAVEKRNDRSRFAARLPADLYTQQIKSDTFPHYFEPEANATINDHPGWLGYEASYSINADTLNERDDYSVIKPPNTYRILVLGDSFTYGLFVNTYENYSELLEDSLNAGGCVGAPHYEVINLGVPAYDVGFAAERYKLRGAKYKPDLVIWYMNFFTFLIDADRKMELESEYLAKIPDNDRWRTMNGRETFYPGQLAWEQHAAEVPEDERIIRQEKYFRDFLASYDGKLLVVLNDARSWIPAAKGAVERAVLYRSNARMYLPEPLKPDAELLADGHPNVRGHQKIAADLYAYLQDHYGVAPAGLCPVQ